MTQSQLERLGKKWIRLLKLQPPAWEEITFEFRDHEELEKNAGMCLWQTEYRTAAIYIADPESYDETHEAPDIEETLVHELLHLLLEGYSSEKRNYDPNYERGLDIIAQNLVKKRK
jgi:hypothetical protein